MFCDLKTSKQINLFLNTFFP